MDINELNSFKLSDAVKFHDKLNPRLWIDKKLDPEVRKQLLVIAEDFMSSLGIGELDIVDITVSGSNAAYSYTPHSDLDLHIVVNIPKLNDTVYRELFTAKKTLYNDSHDITIHGVPVEVYIQDANEPVNSLGEYSVTDDKWIHIPKKKKANFDEAATRAKYENLKDIVDLALNSNSTDRVQKTIDTVRRYRKAGLHKKGEFGPENLAYKAIRSQGGIDALYDKLHQLQGENLSIEEDASREDAILKIRKLINTTGRSQAEIDNINNIVNQMMKKYNISPAEIDFKPNLATGDKDNDILTKKMAAAAYQKAQAAQGFRDELDKIKAKFKNFFAEDQQLDETVEENQIVNLLSTDIAKKIVNYLNHPKRRKQLAGIQRTEFTARQLNLPTIKDPVIADAISKLVIITGVGPEKTAAWYNGSIDTPMIAVNMRAMLSEPNRFGISSNVHLAHSIANTISHELQHLVDGAKTNDKALKYPKNYDRDSMEQYLNLTFEINSRLQQVLHEFYFITRAAKKKDGTPFTKKDLPALIDSLFRHHMLTREYIKDQKVYNRLLTRSYKFLEYLLDNPVKINEPTFVKKAMNFILGKPTSGSIHESLGLSDESNMLLQETARENQIITIVSKLITNSALAKLGDRSDEELASSPIVIHVNKLNLPEIKDPNIAEPLSKLRVFLGYKHNDSERITAYYQTTPGKPLLDPIIVVNMFYIHKIVYDFKKLPNSANNPLATTKGAFASVLAHEIQHMVDDYKSKGKALAKPKKYDKTSTEQYLNLNAEVNARLQQALGEVSEVLSNYVKRNDSSWSAKDTPFLLSVVFRKYSLSREDIKDSKVYNRIATRTYKFVEDFLANPVKINEPTFVKKAMNFILGKPTSGSINESSEYNQYENEIEEFIQLLNSDDVGVEQIGPYSIHFEGFGDWCQQDAQERCELPPSDPRHLASYDDVYKEVVRDFVKREGGKKPLKFGFAGDEDYPVIYAVFENPESQDDKDMWNSKLDEASGYIPSEKEKNDPRFKTALTVDVRPDSIKKNAKAFNWKTSRAGIPPQARADGKLVSGHKKS